MHNPAAHAQYQLSELELPSKRPSGRGLSSPPPPGKSVLADMIYSIEMVREHPKPHARSQTQRAPSPS